MEQYLTVKQFAEQAGVSTQRIYQLLTKSLQPFCKIENGNKYLSVEGLKVFNKEGLQEVTNELQSDLQGLAKDLPSGLQEVAKGENELLKETIEALKQQLTVKDEQLAAKDKQLGDLTAALLSAQEQHKALTDALTAAQALHAGTIQERLTMAQDQTEEENEDIAEEAEKTKSGFWKRLFGKNK